MTPDKGLPLKSEWRKLVPLSEQTYMLLCGFHTQFQPFQLLSLSTVLQHKLQRLKLSRHLVLAKHLKHMSKTDYLLPAPPPPDPIPSTPWPILDDGKYFLPVADVRPFRLTHNPHPIYREIPLALPSIYIQKLTTSLHLHLSNSAMTYHHASPGLLQRLLFKHQSCDQNPLMAFHVTEFKRKVLKIAVKAPHDLAIHYFSDLFPHPASQPLLALFQPHWHLHWSSNKLGVPRTFALTVPSDCDSLPQYSLDSLPRLFLVLFPIFPLSEACHDHPI